MSKQIDEAAAIDERYGLEPVIDVAAEQRGDVLESFVELGCPCLVVRKQPTSLSWRSGCECAE
jgi:hypothetical protein